MKRLKTLPIHEAATAFAALGSEQRLEILNKLVRSGPDGLSTGQLGKRTGISGSTLTHHLRILNTAGLIRQSKNGRSIICSVADFGRVELLSQFLLRECCADIADCKKVEEPACV